jgi:lipoprotein-releasing system permease protein
MQTMIRNVMSICILLVAVFGIYNVLNMIVSQKRKEIGILRSMGFTGSEVSHLFLVQGLIFGAVGGFLGLIAGYLICRYLGTLHIGVPGTIAYRNMIITYDWQIYAKAFTLSLGASVFAGWIPARGAGKLNPIDIVRGEGG